MTNDAQADAVADADHEYPTATVEPFEFKSMLTPELMGILMDPIHNSRVATRSQGGQNLSYVEAYDIKATLIRFFGFGGFNAEVIDSKIVSVREAPTVPTHVDRSGNPKTPQVIAQSTVRLTIFGLGPQGRDAIYTETSIGANSGWDIGETADNAIKTAASDALKRCAIYLGDQFGLSLYNKGSKEALVRFMFQPEQQEMLRQEVERRASNQTPPDPSTQQALARATGNA